MTTRTASTRTRLSPEERRSQLLDLGVRLLSSRSLDELSIDLLAEEAGISRGLLYHYFGSKQAFHEAVVRRAADDLVAQTAPPVEGEPLCEVAVVGQRNRFDGLLGRVRMSRAVVLVAVMRARAVGPEEVEEREVAAVKQRSQELLQQYRCAPGSSSSSSSNNNHFNMRRMLLHATPLKHSWQL